MIKDSLPHTFPLPVLGHSATPHLGVGSAMQVLPYAAQSPALQFASMILVPSHLGSHCLAGSLIKPFLKKAVRSFRERR